TYTKRIINNKNVKCLQKGCDYQDLLSEYLKHKCPFEEIQCENEGCKSMIQRRKMKEHQQECEFRSIQRFKSKMDILPKLHIIRNMKKCVKCFLFNVIVDSKLRDANLIIKLKNVHWLK